jgi:hypothetical protein
VVGERRIHSVAQEKKEWISMVYGRYLEVEREDKWIRERKMPPM